VNPLDHGHLPGSTSHAVVREAQQAATINDPINLQIAAASQGIGAQGDGGQTAPSVIATVLPLSDITLDPSIQCRASIESGVVDDYAENIAAVASCIQESAPTVAAELENVAGELEHVLEHARSGGGL
jgi:hypothetical protein